MAEVAALDSMARVPDAYCVVFTRDSNGFNFEVHGVPDWDSVEDQICRDLIRAAAELLPDSG